MMTPDLIGASLPRPDATGKVTGSARYPADLVTPAMYQLQVVFAGRPHARILAIETSEALQIPGVIAVITAMTFGGKLQYYVDWSSGLTLLGIGDDGRYIIDGRFLHAIAACTKLVDVLEHDHSGLNRDSEQGEKSNTGGNTEIGMREEKREQTADACQHDIHEN